MGAVVTSSGRYDQEWGPWSGTSGSLTQSGSVSTSVATNRYVNSYRTGKDIPDPQDYINTPGDEGGMYHYLHQLDESSGENDYSNWDKGHEFVTWRQELVDSTAVYKKKSSDLTQSYSGPLVLRSDTGDTYAPGDPGLFPNSNYYGTRAIRATAPTNPNVALSEILGQTLQHQELPNIQIKLLADRSGLFRSLGQDYLNLEFGWKPFLNDVRGLAGLIKGSSMVTRQFLRDAELRVRRKFQFPVENSTSTKTTLPTAIKLVNPANINLTKLFVGVTGTRSADIYLTKRKIWFKGAYMYKLPTSSSIVDKLARWEEQSQQLLGLDITPDTLWELSPWTWMSDWIANIGDILHNISLFSDDNLVLQYGYLMCTTTVLRDLCVDDMPFGTVGAAYNRIPVSTRYRTIRKERIRATPYGFGLNPSTFTGTQWSILSALGLTRAYHLLP